MDDLLRNWKHKIDAGIMLKRNLYPNTLLFADNQVIIQDSEDKLQKSVYVRIKPTEQRPQPQNIHSVYWQENFLFLKISRLAVCGT
jgi:hypothetical protein